MYPGVGYGGMFEPMQFAMRRRNPACANYIRQKTEGTSKRRQQQEMGRRASSAASVVRRASTVRMVRARSNSSTSRVAARVQERLALRRKQAAERAAQDVTKLPTSPSSTDGHPPSIPTPATESNDPGDTTAGASTQAPNAATRQTPNADRGARRFDNATLQVDLFNLFPDE